MSQYDPLIDASAARLGFALQRAGWTATTAESCTGGGIAEAITRISGSSAWFETGFITYANSSKARWLGVGEDVLLEQGAVSEQVVRAMATGAREAAGAQIGVAVSGIAGPDGGSADKPVGTVWFAWSGPEDQVVSECRRFHGDRRAVRAQTVLRALEGLLAQTREWSV